MFLPGVHTLDVGVVHLAYLERVTFLGDSSSLPNITSTISCTQSSGFVFERVSKVQIQRLAFILCGSYNVPTSSYNTCHFTGNILPAVSALYIGSFHLVNCKMEHNYLSLYSCKSFVTSENNTFEENIGVYGGAIRVSGRSVIFSGRNTFQNNFATEKGGGIYGVDADLFFNGPVEFLENNAFLGGAIYASRSSTHFGEHVTSWSTDNTTEQGTGHFVQNLATAVGGAIAMDRSDMKQHSGQTLTFTGNSAYVHGGAVWAKYGDIILGGMALFDNNTAFLGAGGAVNLRSCTWNSTMLAGKNNRAISGGVVYSDASHLHFKGNSEFMHNSASDVWVSGVPWDKLRHYFPPPEEQREERGGVLFLLNRDSEASFYKNATFVNNSATYEGGAIFSFSSTIKFLGDNEFLFADNSASDGGAILSDGSIIKFTGTNTFRQNSAQGQGGALYEYDLAEVHFTGCTTFRGNSGRYGGGISAEAYSIVTFNSTGEDTFSGNVAEQGGGWLNMYVQSDLSFTGNGRFINNSAGEIGGAINIWSTSHAVFRGEGRFESNLAIFGGAVAIQGGTTSLDGQYDFDYFLQSSMKSMLHRTLPHG